MRTKTKLLGTLVLAAAMSAAALADEKPAGETPPEPTTQSTPSQPAQPQTDQAKDQQSADDENKVVCKKEPPPVGSRMGGRKVCRTVAEWRRIQAAAQETTTEIQERKVAPQAN